MTNDTPKSANEFVRKWKTPNDLEKLITGGTDFPNMHRRQNHLVGQVLDACVVLHVYERIKWGDSLNTLRYFFPTHFPNEKFAELVKAPDDDKLKILVKMIHSTNPDNRLQNHRLLVKDKKWKEYDSAFKNYLAECKIMQDNPQQYHGESTTPPPEMPIDPRISAINDEIRSTIHLVSSGSKTQSAIEAKTGRNKVEYKDIKDVNRVMVLPVRPQYADDFTKIIKLLNPDKLVEKQKTIPRIYVEPEEVFSNGYYNQKVFVALDKANVGEGVTNGNLATMAEIKMLPAKMLIADELSKSTKQVSNLLKNIDQYTSDPIDKNKQACRIKLRAAYNIQKREFEKLVEKNDLPYHFPNFNDKKLDNPKTYDELGTNLLDLSKQIHTDAIIGESPDWQKKYLHTSLKQQLNPKDAARDDKISNECLQQIAEAGQFDINKIAKSIRAEMPKDKTPERKRT